MIRAFKIGDDECTLVPLPATRVRAPEVVLQTGDENLEELSLLACKHRDRTTFDHIYAPYVFTNAPQLRFIAAVPLPDPFRLLGSGMGAMNDRNEQDEELLSRINDLRSWGYMPTSVSSAIFAFLHFPLCFEYMLGWLGHLLVPKAALVLYPRFGVAGIDMTGWTNVMYLRYIARDMYGAYPTRTRGLTVEFIAMMARMAQSKLVLSKVLRKRRTVASVSGEHVWRNFDIGPFCAYAWRHQGHKFLPFPFAVTELQDIPKYLKLEAQCREVNKRLCF